MDTLPEQQARQTIDAMLAESFAVWRTKTDISHHEQTRIVAEVERRLSVVEELHAVPPPPTRYPPAAVSAPKSVHSRTATRLSK